MCNKTTIIVKMWHHCIVSPIPPTMSWNMLLMPVVESLTECPVDSITLDAASPRLSSTFSFRSPTLFMNSSTYCLDNEQSPCDTDFKVAPRAVPIPSNVSPSPLSIWRSFSSCIASWTLEKFPASCKVSVYQMNG